MKKLFIAVMAVAAISFASCGNKAQSDASQEQVEASAEAVDIENATNDLAAQLEAGDASKVQEALEAIKEKAAQLLSENPELAKEYLTKVQNYLKENTEKIKAVVGDNAAVQTVVTTLTDSSVDTVIDGLRSTLGSAQEAGQAAVDGAVDQVESAAAATQQAVQDKADEVRQAAEDKVQEGKDKAAEAVSGAAQKANEKINEGADRLLKGAGLK